MSAGKLRESIREVLRGALRREGVGCFLRGHAFGEGGDIDLWVEPGAVPDLLQELEGAFFDRHEIAIFYDFSHKEIVKVDLVDGVTGEKDHIDVWYYRNFRLAPGTWRITKELLRHLKEGEAGSLEAGVEGSLYLLHLLDRKKEPGEKERKRVDAYRAAEHTPEVLECWEAAFAGDPTGCVARLVKAGILAEGRDEEGRRRWHHKRRPGRGVFAVLGADGVGKTTTIDAVSELLKSGNVGVRTVWEKFIRVYHKAWVYRKRRNRIKRLDESEDRKDYFERRAALEAALFRMPLVKWMTPKGKLQFIDRYFPDLAIRRKESPLVVYDDLYERSFSCCIPDGVVLLRAAPETIYGRRPEMPLENFREYYDLIWKWTFERQASCVVSISTERMEVEASSRVLADFLEEAVLRG